MPRSSAKQTTRRSATASVWACSSSAGDATRSTARFTDARNWVGVCSPARSNTSACTTVVVDCGVNERVASARSVACRCEMSPARNSARVAGSRPTRSVASAIRLRIDPGGTRSAAATWSRVNPSVDRSEASNAASSSAARACNSPMCRSTATRASI